MPKRDGRPFHRVTKFLKESHIVIRFAKERALFLKINDITVISFFGMSDCHLVPVLLIFVL
jgi:hypothetical protein